MADGKAGGKLGAMQKATAEKGPGDGRERFAQVEKSLFVGGSAEARSSASEESRTPVATPEPPVKRTKITVALREEDHHAWRVKLAREGLDGQTVLEKLVLEYLAKSTLQ